MRSAWSQTLTTQEVSVGTMLASLHWQIVSFGAQEEASKAVRRQFCWKVRKAHVSFTNYSEGLNSLKKEKSYSTVWETTVVLSGNEAGGKSASKDNGVGDLHFANGEG